MNPSEIKCKICGCVNDQKIISFKSKTLEKCQHALRVRKKNNLKYSDVDLANLNCNDGYHSEYYRYFTALKQRYSNQEKDSSASSNPSVTPEPSNSVENAPDVEDHEHSDDDETADENKSSTAIPNKEKVCFLCGKHRKRIKKKYQNLRQIVKQDTKDSFQTLTERLLDSNIFILENGDINIGEVFGRLERHSDYSELFYHNYCYHILNNKFSSVVNGEVAKNPPEPSEWHETRTLHKRAFEETLKFVTEDVGINKNMLYLSDVCKQYNKKLQSLCTEHDIVFTKISAQSLKKKLQQSSANDVVTFIIRKQKTLIIPTDDDNGLLEIDFDKFDISHTTRQEAWKLRKVIMKIEKHDLPEKFTCEDLISGECTIPEQLKNFITEIGNGPYGNRKKNPSFIRTVNSICSDIIHFVSNGRIKTSKHLTLGLTLKSKTGSKDIINIMNRYGHTCSYNVLKGIETEAAFTSNERSQLCPQDIKLLPNLCTGVAWDNFDRYVDTRSGKDTLHDTVGIIYQNIDDSAIDVSRMENTIIDQSVLSSNEKRKRRRTTFDAIIPEIIMSAKKPRVRETLLSKCHELRALTPKNLQRVKKLNLMWMISHALEIQDTPLFVGFNHLLLEDDSPRQKVSYLNPINLPPKDDAVVIETMRQSLEIANECQQQYMQVTYDLAISKIALEIQSKDDPNWRRLFIHFGVFHIILALFRASGKFIDNGGLPHMLTECELLANGSINGFIGGTHYKRCNRLHQISYLALRALHFKEFCNEKHFIVDNDEGILSLLQNFQKKKISVPMIQDDYLLDILKQYTKYEAETLEGEHGKTAQYYMIYINIIEHYLSLQRSVRTGDFELFKYVLPKITNLFFFFDQPNYSRWMVKYHDNLLRVDETHPGLKDVFDKGYFGVKRTTKAFSKQPIDLTLEQTINADAARTQSGVIHFTNSIAARQLWTKNSALRTTMISHTYSEMGLNKNEDITADLGKSQLKRNFSDVQKLINILQENVNSFDSNLDKGRLYNISTATPVSDEIANSLLNVEKKGDELRNQFISDVADGKRSFYDRIKQNKPLTFNDSTKRKIIKVAGKEQEIRLQRDLFGRMLGLSLQETDDKIDVKGVVSFPLTPIPLSMCHMNGEICKTSKSTLQTALESKIKTSSDPIEADICIVDGFFMLHLMRNVPLIYSNISKSFLRMITNCNAPRIDLVFDRYFSPSIKDNERSRREGHEAPIHKITENLKRTSDFDTDLRNSRFKEAFVEFLLDHWAKDEMAEYIKDKKINVNYEYCDSFKVINNKVKKARNHILSCPDQEEADTKMIYHVCQIEQEAKVILKCNDTDILIIMLGNMDHLCNNLLKIWIETGVGNNLRYINVTELYGKLGESLSKALPGFHALTGCDYNPAFFGKGKKTPLKKLENSPRYQNAFIDLVSSNFSGVETTVFPVLEDFICKIYNIKKSTNVNDARYEKFTETYIPKKVDEAFYKKLKNYDSSNLPPCQDELYQQLYRTYYIANIWSNANLKTPTDLNPIDCGWEETEDGTKLDFIWFTGKQFPDSIKDVIIQPPLSDNLNDEVDEVVAEEMELSESEDEDDSDCE